MSDRISETLTVKQIKSFTKKPKEIFPDSEYEGIGKKAEFHYYTMQLYMRICKSKSSCGAPWYNRNISRFRM